MNSLDLVRNYFDREARRFDAIYDLRKPLHQRVVDRFFRRVVIERFHLICNLAPSPGRWTALDVGCGPGRYSIALARAGAARVLGLDVAASMITLSCQEAVQAQMQDRCEFLTAGFLDFATTEKFDVVVATGYFDYVEEPLLHLRKMIELCRGKIFASIPKRWEFRVPIRKLRFALQHGFVRFYSRREIMNLVTLAGLPQERVSLIDLGRDWIAILRVG